MTELLSELRRSPVVGDREVADLLQSLQPADDRHPRASEALAAFIAYHRSGVTPPAELPAPAGSSGLLVVLGGATEPKPRRRARVGVLAQVAAAAAIALVAVAVATSGPSRDVVVRPADSSTVAPAATPSADRPDPTPRRHHPARSAGSRPHRARVHPATTSIPGPAVSASAAATSDGEGARESDGAAQPERSGNTHGDETARGTEDGGDTSDDGGGDGGETPDGSED
jgi:hypothetical protein